MHEPNEIENGKDPSMKWDAQFWLLGPATQSLRSDSMLVLIEELVDILRDEGVSDEEALVSVRRVAMLLSAFVIDAERYPHQLVW
ncbi:hypothetical protein [Catelliglobosispora koreensis]|uniref:hypothetical protein n=1 Tax=Catelliglobosispora koreensis TaxID=129052 RepID=UPI00037C23EF|nr:hypothetical protein [Catelliglobosispora koreensis]